MPFSVGLKFARYIHMFDVKGRNIRRIFIHGHILFIFSILAWSSFPPGVLAQTDQNGPRVEPLAHLPDDSPAHYVFPLNLYYQSSTGWTPENIEPHLKRVQAIFLHCDMTASPIRFIPLNLPPSHTEFGAPLDQEIAQMASPLAKPAIFFLGGSSTPQAYGDEFAEGSPRSILTWTAWISPLIHTSLSPLVSPSYDSVAHEVAHILCNCGHRDVPEKNLLSERIEFRSAELTTTQCEKFRESAFVKRKSE
jgi:hypothetical protein